MTIFTLKVTFDPQKMIGGGGVGFRDPPPKKDNNKKSFKIASNDQKRQY